MICRRHHPSPHRPIPSRNDRRLARRASTHKRLRTDGPWPEAGPKRGAGIQPRKGVTKYVRRQLADTVRDSNSGPPDGPLKKASPQASTPPPVRPRSPRTNTPSPPNKHDHAQARQHGTGPTSPGQQKHKTRRPRAKRGKLQQDASKRLPAPRKHTTATDYATPAHARKHARPRTG